tara:strand:- start:415 stop:813 length:399 start_codon:yes stop_codon:yes gene_type:complete
MKINSLITELEVLAVGWEKYAIDHKFSGYTLAQLKALIASLKELMAAMDALKLEYRGKIAARQSMGLELRDIRLRIVHCIRGHEDFGEDSEFYRFLGFKTKSERRSGLTRKTSDSTDAAPPDDDGVDLDDAA